LAFGGERRQPLGVDVPEAQVGLRGLKLELALSRVALRRLGVEGRESKRIASSRGERLLARY
jgi:hypothetical protein